MNRRVEIAALEVERTTARSMFGELERTVQGRVAGRGWAGPRRRGGKGCFDAFSDVIYFG